MTNGNGTKLFCLGLGIGVATAFLLTPRSGRAYRRYLRSKAEDGADYISRQTQDLVNGAADILDHGAKALRRQKESLMAAVDAGKNALRGEVASTTERDYQL
jgi:gas vesicle protein